MAPRKRTFESGGFIPKDERERVLCRQFDQMFDGGARATRGQDRDSLAIVEAVRCFMNSMTPMGDKGYLLFAQLFAEEVEGFHPDRAVCSGILTAVARTHTDEGKILRESRIHHIGRAISSILELSNSKPGASQLIRTLVEWAEDMGKTEPTSVIRGSFLAPYINQKQAAAFWGEALDCRGFPWRMFSDPCRSESGVIFTAHHMSAIASVLSHAPEAAAKRICLEIMENAVTKNVLHLDGPNKARKELRIGAKNEEIREVHTAIAEQVRSKATAERSAYILRLLALS